MPPKQCPECGRFLSRAFIASLKVETAPCPKCATPLPAALFGVPEADVAPTGRDEEPANAAQLRAETPMMSEDLTDPPPPPPPTVASSTPASPPASTLAGWDDHETLEPSAGGAPPDAAIVAGAGVFGALVGMLVASRRGRGGLLGLIAGVLAAAVARRVWELDDQG